MKFNPKELLASLAQERLTKDRAGGLLPWTPGIAAGFENTSVEDVLLDKYFLNLGNFIHAPILDEIISIYYEREQRKRLNLPPIERVILEKAIGSGKSYEASILIYLEWFYLSVYYNPQAHFGLDPRTTIAIICLSQNASKAKEVMFNYVKPLFESCRFNLDYFPCNPRIKTRLLIPRNRTVIFPGTGEAASVLGYNVYSAVVDEINFISVSGGKTNMDQDLNVDQAGLMESEIRGRQRSRFGDRRGHVPGLFIGISAKGYLDSYTSRTIKMDQELQREGLNYSDTWWSTLPRWDAVRDLKDWWYFYADEEERESVVSEITRVHGFPYLGFLMDKSTHEIVKVDVAFVLAYFALDAARTLMGIFEEEYTTIVALPDTSIENNTLESLIIDGQLAISEIVISDRYVLAPIMFYGEAIDSPELFLRNTANVSIASISPFIRDTGKLYAAVSKTRRSPVILIEDTPKLPDGFICTDNFYRFMHIDLSISGDAIGMAMCHVSHFIKVEEYSHKDAKMLETQRPYFVLDFLERIVIPAGKEADYNLIFFFIMDLRDRGFPISLITFDRFQSHSIIVSLRDAGFISTTLSIDHTGSKVLLDNSKEERFKRASTSGDFAAAMGTFKSAILQSRVDIPEHAREPQTKDPYVVYEAKHLEWVGDKGKVIKKRNLSDDVVQAAAGAMFNAENNVSAIPVVSKLTGEAYADLLAALAREADVEKEILGSMQNLSPIDSSFKNRGF